MSGMYTDTRQSRGVPNIRVTYGTDRFPGKFNQDELLTPSRYLHINTEQNLKYPAYRDTVTSFRTNRTSLPNPRSGIFSDVPIIESLTPDQVKPDTGHEFDSYTHELVPWDRFRERKLEWNYGSDYRIYRGPLFHSGALDLPSLGIAQQGRDGSSMWGPAIPDLTPDWGTKAIAKVAPTKSNASIATALIELRDGLPNMPGRALKNARGFKDLTKVGPEEFLNYVFGLVPTLSDIRSIAIAIVNQKKILDQFQRDNDKVVRRRYGFPLKSSLENWDSTVSTTRLYHTPFGTGDLNGIQDYIWSTDARVSRTLSRTDRIWFSGAFRYHLASTDSQWGRIERTSQLMAKLLGARLDAEALWAAMPWSWLVDWFSDTGDIISNATHQILDGQLLQYGYVMCHSIQHSTFTTKGLVTTRGQAIGDLTTAFVSQRKQRIKATPYGFGLNPDSFSPQQWAILGALGMTKGPKSLF